ncbi:MAG: response regulator transcription factor [Hyphomicrobiaceae bacterium]
MTRTILIAEDEPFIVESLTFLFERAGYRVVSAEDGRSTLHMIRSVAPDLIVLDAMMRFATGFDVLKSLRNDSSITQPKVLMLTAKGQKADRQLALDLGADDYIAKPFSNRDVLATVSRLLSN